MNSERHSTKHLPWLDGLRGITAIIVVLHHIYFAQYHAVPFGIIACPNGFLAVDLFFVMSGYVLGKAYSERLKSGLMTGWDFLKVRFVRLWPAYCFSIFLAVLAIILTQNFPNPIYRASIEEILKGALLALIFIPNLFPGNLHGWELNNPWWSLFYEVLMNGVLWIIITGKIRVRVSYLVAGSFLLLIVISLHKMSINSGFLISRIQMFTGMTRSSFGILLGYMLFTHQEFLKSIKRFEPPVFFSMALTIGVLLLPFTSWVSYVVQLLAIALIFPTTVLVISEKKENHPALVSVLRWLGNISYPLYLIHLPILNLAIAAIPHELIRWKPWSAVCFILSSLLFSDIVYRCVDLPGRILLKGIIFKGVRGS